MNKSGADSWRDPAGAKRLTLLAELGVLDTPPDFGLDALAEAAAEVARCPIALITLLDGEREWFKAQRGTDMTQLPMSDSPGRLVMNAMSAFEIRDLAVEPEIRLDVLVTPPARLRFYFGEPLLVHGVAVGTLCVMDIRPRTLQPHAKAALHGMARAASSLLTGRRADAMVQTRRRLDDIWDVSGDWLWETDEQHRITWIGSTDMSDAVQLAPWHLGETMRDGPILDSSGERQQPQRLLHELFDDRQAFAHVIVACPGPRETRYTSHSALARHDAAGAWQGYRGIGRDVTSRVRANRSMRSSAALLSELSVQVPGLIFQFSKGTDGCTKFPYASAGVADIYELEPASLAEDARPALARVHPEDRRRVVASIDESAERLCRWEATYRVLLPHAGERVLSGHAEPKRLEDGSTLWHGLITDITTQTREAERLQRLDEARVAAERAAQLRGEFMSRVSHELRTPLNAILGFAQLLRQQGLAATAADTARAAAQIEIAGSHLLSLINDMLDLSSLDAGHLQLRPQPVDVGALVQRCLTLVGPHAGQHGVTLRLQVDDAVPTVRADRRAAKQIVFNLVGNAIKFSPPRTEIGLRVRVEGDSVLLDVADRGVGIAADKLATIFEPFTRVRLQDGIAGSGLGLSISQRLAQAMEGRIEVRSQEGRGAVFSMRLPVDGRCEDLYRNDSGFGGLDSPPAQDESMSTGRVLYIEDEPVNAMLMQTFFDSLPSRSLRLIGAADGRAGLAAAHSGVPDLILLDMNLPDMTGLQLLEQLRADPRTSAIPVIAVSADALPEQVEHALSAGCEDYWTKPIDFRQARAELARRFPGSPR